MTNISVARVRASEAAQLSAFASKCFGLTYGPFCRADDIAAYVAASLSPSAFLAILTSPTTWVLAATIDGDWVGYAQLQLAPLPDGIITPYASELSPTAMELSRFYVAGQWHGLGVAPALLSSVLEQAVSQGSKTLWLTVWQENARAIAFYEKSGFARVGTSTFHLGRETQQDFVMQRVLGKPAARRARHY